MGQSTTSKKPRENPFNGAALVPGNPGNSGGKKGRSGRPPSAVRDACRLAFQQRIKVLKEIADGVVVYRLRKDGDKPGEDELLKLAPTPADRIRAVDTLGKYGGIQKVEHTGADDAPLIPPGRLSPEEVRQHVARFAASHN